MNCIMREKLLFIRFPAYNGTVDKPVVFVKKKLIHYVLCIGLCALHIIRQTDDYI